MKGRDKLFTGILLLLIGVLIGIILTFLRQGNLSFDNAEVKFTEINRSEVPAWSDEDLEKIDDRFVFRSVANTVTPTVVYIETIVPSQSREIEGMEGDDDSIWRRFMPPRSNTVGSGVLISGDGYILTNNHVVEHAVRDGISITLQDKRMFDARIVGRDPSTDLAVLKIDGENLPQITIGNSNNLGVGEWVLAVGNPFRLQSTVTAGIVSALGRDVQIIDDVLRIESFIQTDAAINRGNSGGALVNTSGELIGINTAIATQSGSYQGYGFAVPSNLAMKVAQDIMEFGEVRRGMLGVTIQSVDERIARRAGLDEIRGVILAEVGGDGAADKAGLSATDIILEVNGESVDESNQLQEKVAMFRPGDVITLSIWRAGERLERDVELEELERPEPIEMTFDEPEIRPEEERYFDELPEYRDGSGIIYEQFEEYGFSVRGLASPESPQEYEFFIHRIAPNSIAKNRGLKEGFEIIEMDGERVQTTKEIERRISEVQKENRSLQLKIRTESGATGYYSLQ